MTRITSLTAKFVEFIPRELEKGTLYISIPYATAIHSCCCGCGNKVVTPFSPAEWKLIFDGCSVSLEPSIGNWNFPCKSHYWINNSQVSWSRQFSEGEIERVQRNDERDAARYFGSVYKTEEKIASKKGKRSKTKAKRGPIKRLGDWLRSKGS